jgi:electron transport complex protein RnfC
MNLSFFRQLASFKNGIHPAEFKDYTAHLPIRRMDFVDEYIIPMNQHIGAPSRPVVRVNQKVGRGELIALADGFVSVAQHSPVDGVVTDIRPHLHPSGQMEMAVIIRRDFSSPQLIKGRPLNWEETSFSDFIRIVQESGIVGLGGAAFPAHVKFNVPEGKKCKYLLLNGCECEPFLTADHRVMLEYPDRLFAGIRILQHFLKCEQVFIGIENNKPDAIALLSSLVQEQKLNASVVPLNVKYPQGAEKMLISAILKCEVPRGSLPIDKGCVVSNVATAVAVADRFQKGWPLLERVVTVAGPGIRKSANLLVPIGTPVFELIEKCGGLEEKASRIILGGPMMGTAQKSLQVPVTKGTSGILVLTDELVKEVETHKCIRCGRCVDACPMFLQPNYLGLLARKGLFSEMAKNSLKDCMECASCSFVCPSGIPLVQLFRSAKHNLRNNPPDEDEKG